MLAQEYIPNRFKQIEPMSADEEAGLIIQAQAGDRDATARLYEQFAPALWALTRRVYSRWETREDMFQWASLFFLRALSRFEADRGARLHTFMAYFVRQKLWQIASTTSLVRVPANITCKSNANAALALRRFTSFDSKHDRIAVEDASDQVDEHRQAEVLASLRGLHERDRSIILRGVSGERDVDIARDLGISRQRVLQIKGRAMERILTRINLAAIHPD